MRLKKPLFAAVGLPLILFGPPLQGQSPLPISPLLADRGVAGIPGKVGVELAGPPGYLLKSVTLGNETYQSRKMFPTFTILDNKGRRRTLAGSNPVWRVFAKPAGRQVAACACQTTRFCERLLSVSE